MRIDQVPQDNNQAYQGHFRATYAVDEAGNYVVAKSSGWKVEEVVNDQAVSFVDQQIERARQQVLSGSASPLTYYMTLRQMTPGLLAAEARIAVWRVRRHLKPKRFEKLPASLLERYATALGLTVGELRHVPS